VFDPARHPALVDLAERHARERWAQPDALATSGMGDAALDERQANEMDAAIRDLGLPALDDAAVAYYVQARMSFEREHELDAQLRLLPPDPEPPLHAGSPLAALRARSAALHRRFDALLPYEILVGGDNGLTHPPHPLADATWAEKQQVDRWIRDRPKRLQRQLAGIVAAVLLLLWIVARLSR